MDIHVNDLIIEEGFQNVRLKDISFRDIDQEFILVKTKDSFNSIACNYLYYCFIKPYQGLFFRKLGETDEFSKKIYVNESLTEVHDAPYKKLADELVSKIVENGDLISNQLLVDIPFEYYGSNEELEELMETRSVRWIDKLRERGNPDYLQIEGEGEKNRLKIIRCDGNAVIAADEAGQIHTLTEDKV